ncbi:H+/Cl-antiporter ClcA [Cetobacterium ceti]|uniref:H+/Cl-antiporter ClcA n=1 Tax=Cetobacterium ceti TaxID=180163 RepID=A0A1T4LHW4_9FUSO|nr:chloride channel protein [Cetobacterium ceti]SJZ53994.1 H+/Cl-antiporter ClcA [Cetobacterium ceti]
MKDKSLVLRFFLKWILIGGIVGVIVGTVCVIFLNSLHFVTHLREKNPMLLFLLPFGGAFVSWLYVKYGKNSSRGTNLILEEIYEDKENIPLRMGFLVFLGTIVTHLFGGSAGREGTAVQMGAAIADKVGNKLGLNKKNRRLILMAGISAGFGAVFGIPLAGAIFAIEVIQIGKIEYEGLIPCVISSFIGQLIALQLHVKHSIYKANNISAGNFSLEVILKVIFASILFAIASILFSQGIHLCKKIYTKFFPNLITRSFAGGVVVIILVYIFGTRDYIGLGTGFIESSFHTTKTLLDPIFKIIFTSVTLGAGFQGGEVTPLFFTGASLGSALSHFLNLPAPFLASLGLVAVFAGATNTPISSFIMGIELFGGHNASYLFLACMISYLFSGNKGIYSSQQVAIDKVDILEEREKL